MLRKIIAAFFLIGFLTAATALETEIRDSCLQGEEPMLSLNDTEGGHVAEPGYYGNQLCVEGAEEFEIKKSCSGIRTVSIQNRTNSHLSAYDIFNLGVCSRSIIGSINKTCGSNSIEALSVTSDNNTHVGEPGYFGKALCLKKETPEKVRLQISGLEGDFYADNSPISEGENFSLVEYPYIVSEENSAVKGLVSYSEFRELGRTSNSIYISQTGSSFLLPFTSGGRSELEDEEEQILNRRFLNLLSPSFSYNIPEKPSVKVLLQKERNIDGFRGESTRNIRLKVENRGLEDNSLLLDYSLK